MAASVDSQLKLLHVGGPSSCVMHRASQIGVIQAINPYNPANPKDYYYYCEVRWLRSIVSASRTAYATAVVQRVDEMER